MCHCQYTYPSPKVSTDNRLRGSANIYMCVCARTRVRVRVCIFFRRIPGRMPRIASPLPCRCPARFITSLFIDSADATARSSKTNLRLLLPLPFASLCPLTLALYHALRCRFGRSCRSFETIERSQFLKSRLDVSSYSTLRIESVDGMIDRLIFFFFAHFYV